MKTKKVKKKITIYNTLIDSYSKKIDNPIQTYLWSISMRCDNCNKQDAIIYSNFHESVESSSYIPDESINYIKIFKNLFVVMFKAYKIYDVTITKAY